MPSPFPGMDPYLEGDDLWPAFHLYLALGISRRLTAATRPRFVARINERRFTFLTSDPVAMLYRFDGVMSVGDVLEGRDVEVTAKQRFLEVCRPAREGGGVVTVLHFVSPHEKMPGSAGERELARHRDATLTTGIKWLEIDLLRGGVRPVAPDVGEAADYRVVWLPGRSDGSSKAISWNGRDPLPTIGVSLSSEDESVWLDLHEAVETACAEAIDNSGVDYAADPPELGEGDAAWLDALLREKGLRPA